LNTDITVEADNLSSSDFLIKCRAKNSEASSNYSTPSGMIQYRPVQTTQNIDNSTSIGGLVAGIGAATALSSVVGALTGNTSSGGLFSSIFNSFKDKTGIDLTNANTKPATTMRVGSSAASQGWAFNQTSSGVWTLDTTGAGGSSGGNVTFPTNSTGYLYNDGTGTLTWVTTSSYNDSNVAAYIPEDPTIQSMQANITALSANSTVASSNYASDGADNIKSTYKNGPIVESPYNLYVSGVGSLGGYNNMDKLGDSSLEHMNFYAHQAVAGNVKIPSSWDVQLDYCNSTSGSITVTCIPSSYANVRISAVQHQTYSNVKIAKNVNVWANGVSNFYTPTAIGSTSIPVGNATANVNITSGVWVDIDPIKVPGTVESNSNNTGPFGIKVYNSGC
jgi:hypothetical protein